MLYCSLKARWRTRGRNRAGEAGFTLIELLVVLAIISLLASLIAPRVLRYLSSARGHTAAVQLRNLATALDLYRLEVGRYPTKPEGLRALLEQPASAQGWQGPYIDRAEQLNDPWGRPYRYTVPGKRGAFDLLTLGADGAEGGD